MPRTRGMGVSSEKSLPTTTSRRLDPGRHNIPIATTEPSPGRPPHFSFLWVPQMWGMGVSLAKRHLPRTALYSRMRRDAALYTAAPPARQASAGARAKRAVVCQHRKRGPPPWRRTNGRPRP